jgi:hypothetical protein
MSAADQRRIPLTVNQILELAGIVDIERERIRRMIEEHPTAEPDNEKRRGT